MFLNWITQQITETQTIKSLKNKLIKKLLTCCGINLILSYYSAQQRAGRVQPPGSRTRSRHIRNNKNNQFFKRRINNISSSTTLIFFILIFYSDRQRSGGAAPRNQKIETFRKLTKTINSSKERAIIFVVAQRWYCFYCDVQRSGDATPRSQTVQIHQELQKQSILEIIKRKF